MVEFEFEFRHNHDNVYFKKMILHVSFILGVGAGMVIVSALVATYYNMIIAWSFYYLFASFTKDLPWAKCDPEWASDCE